MNQKTKLSLLFCLMASLNFYSACTKSPAASQPLSAAGTSVENAARAAASEPVMNEQTHQLYQRECEQCHGADGRGLIAIAPDLRRSASRSAEEWEKYLRNPKSFNPQATKSAPRGMSDDDFRAMAEYLAALTQHNPLPEKK
jgi:cytochrome c553